MGGSWTSRFLPFERAQAGDSRFENESRNGHCFANAGKILKTLAETQKGQAERQYVSIASIAKGGEM